MSCKEKTKIENQTPQVYTAGGMISANSANAITFLNTGTTNASLNGYIMSPGVSLSFGGHECQEDCTKYKLTFPTASSGNSVTVFRGSSAVVINSLTVASGVSAPVNIHDSNGDSIFATAGALNVNDPNVIIALNTIDTDLLAFKTANHTDLLAVIADLVTLDNSVNAFKTQAHNDSLDVQSDVQAVSTEISAFATQNHTDLTDFAAQNHTDLLDVNTEIQAVSTEISAFATQNHTDLTALLDGQALTETAKTSADNFAIGATKVYSVNDVVSDNDAGATSLTLPNVTAAGAGSGTILAASLTLFGVSPGTNSFRMFVYRSNVASQGNGVTYAPTKAIITEELICYIDFTGAVTMPGTTLYRFDTAVPNKTFTITTGTSLYYVLQFTGTEGTDLTGAEFTAQISVISN